MRYRWRQHSWQDRIETVLLPAALLLTAANNELAALKR